MAQLFNTEIQIQTWLKKWRINLPNIQKLGKKWEQWPLADSNTIF